MKTFVKNNLVFAFFLCQISVESSNHHMKAIKLVVFPVFYTSHCVKLLQNFIQGLRFTVSKPACRSQTFSQCFSFVESFCLFFYSLNLLITTLLLSPHLSTILLSCASRFTCQSFYFNFLHCLGLIDLLSADERAKSMCIISF